jgi:hypothetical protein
VVDDRTHPTAKSLRVMVTAVQQAAKKSGSGDAKITANTVFFPSICARKPGRMTPETANAIIC